MKITVVKEFSFEAAHYLPGYNGPCARLHGHSYRLFIGITGKVDPVTGMVIDFSILKRGVTDSIISQLDHSSLNDVDIPGFPTAMPTAENMVEWIVDVLHGKSQFYCRMFYWLSFVRLYETPTSYAEWHSYLNPFEAYSK